MENRLLSRGVHPANWNVAIWLAWLRARNGCALLGVLVLIFLRAYPTLTNPRLKSDASIGAKEPMVHCYCGTVLRPLVMLITCCISETLPMRSKYFIKSLKCVSTVSLGSHVWLVAFLIACTSVQFHFPLRCTDQWIISSYKTNQLCDLLLFPF